MRVRLLAIAALAIRPVVEALGLDGHPNVNYPKAAKAVVGF